MDSLNSLLQAAKDDTTRLRLYNILGEVCQTSDNLKYALPGIALSEQMLLQTKDSVERIKILRQQTVLKIFVAEYYERIEGDIMKALKYLQASLLEAEKLRYKKGMSRFLIQLQFLYADQGDTAQALYYLDKATELEKEIADSSRRIRGYFITGRSYGKMKRYGKALEFFNKAANAYAEAKDTMGMVDALFMAGRVYVEMRQFASALEIYENCFRLSSLIHDEVGKGSAWYLIGIAHKKMGDVEKAIAYHKMALALAQKRNDEGSIEEIVFELTKDYILKKDFREARRYAEPYFKLLNDPNMPLDGRMEIERVAYQVDSGLGNGNEAFKHYQQYVLLKEKFNSEGVLKMAAREKFQRDMEAQRMEQKVQNDLATAEKKKQNIIIATVSIGLFLVLILTAFIFRSLRINQENNKTIKAQKIVVEKQKYLIEQKNNEITDSINYAQRIQHSILPPLEEIAAALPQSFVLFKPKDIVSGDFFWFADRHDKYFIAAADCTGHGVPGAFMSMLNSDKLNTAVEEHSSVSKILQAVNIGVKKALRQSDRDGSSRDGMDVALLAFDKSLKKVEYAGANRPIWIVRNGSNVIEETKATKTAIGGLTEDSQEFVEHIFDLQKGDTVYIFSDGYADQFSPEDKKLMTRKFKENILEIQKLDMRAQKEFLDNFIENWKSNMEQTDDILVIGVKIQSA